MYRSTLPVERYTSQWKKKTWKSSSSVGREESKVFFPFFFFKKERRKKIKLAYKSYNLNGSIVPRVTRGLIDQATVDDVCVCVCVYVEKKKKVKEKETGRTKKTRGEKKRSAKE